MSLGDDVSTWTNAAITDETPIRWTSHFTDGETGELIGNLLIGTREQLVIDMSARAVKKMLEVLTEAQHHTALHPVFVDATSDELRQDE